MRLLTDGAKSPATQARATDTQARSIGTQPHSTAELVRLVSEQASVLVRDELKLAQLEMTRKGKQVGLGAGVLGGGGLIALYGIGCLIACAVLAISLVLAAWLAALIVGAALLVVAAAAALFGKGRLQKATPPVPEEAVARIKADVEVIKQRARR
jgi:Putative Actinobacterial Holin-X, holin superfamily III